ncbi:MAG: hypothetical protein C3F15_14250 [Holophagae bacterium]|nr:MAG: hypothetical protein C3F15_14250 [Holophagae bacterium]
MFDAMLHVGTAAAVVWFERWQLLEWAGTATGRRVLSLLVVGTLATAVVGFALRDVATRAFERPLWVAAFLVVTGCVVAATRWLGNGDRGADRTTWREATIVGLLQGLAVFPGLSRSGTTIAAGLGAGLERSWAARFSFLLGVPAVAGVTVIELLSNRHELAATSAGFAVACAVGAVAAAITGYVALAIVLKTVSSRVFHRFAWYCIPVGLIVFAIVAGSG